jgi:hypothetical protein
VCEKHGLRPKAFYAWQKNLFGEGAAVFEQSQAKSGRQEAAEQRRIAFLEAKLRNKDQVMAELLDRPVDGRQRSIPGDGFPDTCNSGRLVRHFRLNQDSRKQEAFPCFRRLLAALRWSSCWLLSGSSRCSSAC